jgi:hypothetical protein
MMTYLEFNKTTTCEEVVEAFAENVVGKTSRYNPEQRQVT